jgi:negative regulator of sigma E activity
MLQAQDKVSITLEVQYWNAVLEALNSAPYRVAAPIIGELVRQYNEANAASEQPPGSVPQLRNGNGKDAPIVLDN